MAARGKVLAGGEPAMDSPASGDPDGSNLPNGEHRRRNTSRGQGGKQGRGGGGGGKSGGGRGRFASGDADRETASFSAEIDDSNLEPPLPVPEPSAEENNARLDKLRSEINVMETRVSEINAEIQAAKDLREMQEVALKDIKSESSPIRAKIAQLHREKDELIERLKKLSESIKNEELIASRMRKEIQYRTDEEVDRAIAEKNYRLETSSIDLKSEKDLVRDLKKLNLEKDKIKELNAKMEDIKAKRFVHEDLYLQRQAKSAEVKELQDQDKAIQARIDAVRNGEGVENGYNVNAKIVSLLDEKGALIEKLKEKRAEMQEVNVAFRFKLGEYRDYKRAKMAYERKLENIERQKRQAEAAVRAERMKEERKQRDLERKEARRKEEERMLAVAEGCQLYVGGLAIRCEEEAIRAHFERFGTVTHAIVIRDIETKLSKGFGFVTFAEEGPAREAMKQCNGKEAKGLCPQHGRILVKIAEKSRAQQEFEAKRAASAAARARKAAGGDGKGGDSGVAEGQEDGSQEARDEGTNGCHDEDSANGTAEASNGVAETEDGAAEGEDGAAKVENGAAPCDE